MEIMESNSGYWQPKPERDARIVALRDSGVIYRLIGDSEGVSGVRARQIYLREKGLE